MGPAHHSPKAWAICPPVCRGAGVCVCVYMKVDGVLGGKSGCSCDHMHENALSCTYVTCMLYVNYNEKVKKKKCVCS